LPTRAPSRKPAAGRTGWAGIPAAARQSERRTRLLDAGFDLLGTEGGPGTTVRAVCRRARLNPRYFYESFDDLDALVVAVYDRVVVDLRGAVLAALTAAPDDPAAQVRAAVESTVAFVDDDRRRARVLYVEALGNEALNRRRIDTGHAVVTFIERYSAERHGAPRRRGPAGRIGAAILVGGFSELLVSWLDGRIDVSRKRLVEHATAYFLALGDTAADIEQGALRGNRP
jgi:AcrR family transcriptional regulator